MVRLMKTSVVLWFVCIAVPMLAQMPKGQDAVGQAPVAEQRPAGQSAVAPLAATYPLDSFTEFSAVMVGSRVELGEGASEGHIYRSGRLMRTEDPGRLGYFITDLSTGETCGISEAGCMYESHPFIRTFPFFAGQKPVARAALGKETVEGHSCQIEKVTLSSPKFAYPLEMRFWEAEDLRNFPIKIEFLLPGGHDAIVRYRSVVLGPQDPTLFIHPKSCEPLSKKPAAE